MMEITNVKEACRLCLRGEGKISVFENGVKTGAVSAESIFDCVSVKIAKDDTLPTGICENCLLSVENWCSFKITCDRSQDLLQGWLVRDNLRVEGNSITLEDDLKSSFNKCNLLDKPSSSTEPTISLDSNSLSPSRSIDECIINIRPNDDKDSEELLECKYENILLSNKTEHKESPRETSDSDISRSDFIASNLCTVEKPMVPDTIVSFEISDEEETEPKTVNLYDSCVNNNEPPLTPNSNSEESNTASFKNVSDAIDQVSKQSVSDSNINGSDGDLQSIPVIESDENILDNEKTNTLVESNFSKETENLPSMLGNNADEFMNVCDDDSNSVQILIEGKENSFNDSGIYDNKKTDSSSEKAGDEVISCEEDEQIVEFTTAVTIDINPFPVGSETEQPVEKTKNCASTGFEELGGSISAQILVECEKETDQPEVLDEITSLPLDTGEVVSSSLSPPKVDSPAKVDEKEGEVSSSVEKPCPTSEINQEEAIDKLVENSDHPPNSEKDNESFEPLITTIKEEPIDSTTDDTPVQAPLLRVKSEFSTFNFRNESNEDQSWENNERRQIPNPDDPNNSECFVCNRKYSTVSNYRQHLLTKMHLFNSGQVVVLEPSPNKESPKEIPTFESPLLRSRLSSDPLNHPSYAEPSPPPAPPTPPPLKRKLVDHCRLCNTSFSYTSELRKHLLSKKHRLNLRLQRYRGPQAEENFPGAQSLPKLAQRQQDTEKSPNVQESSKSIFICPIQNCHFSCVKGDSLLEHMKVHGIAQPIESVEEPIPPKPKLSLRQQDMLKKEQEMKLKKEAEMKLKREAEMKQFQEQQELIRQRMQLSYMPASIMPFECEGCHKTFFRESGLKKHSWYCKALDRQRFNEDDDEEEEVEGDEVEVEDSLLENDDSEGSVSHCPLCDISFTARNVFINHIQIYHKGSYLESSIPKASGSTKKIPQKTLPRSNVSKLQISSKLRVTNKTHGFSCDICGKKFNLLSSLNFHLKTHTVNVRHICRICKEPFSNRKAFMEHCRQHFLKPGSKETLCHKCFKVFKTRSELYQHRKNDQCSIKLKIYSCNFCQHSFKDPEALEEHKVRFHSESLDMANDTLHGSSYEELYDDSFIPLNPLSLLSQQSDNMPGTSSRVTSGYSKSSMSLKKNFSSQNALSYSNTNAAAYSIKNSPNYSQSPTPVDPPLQCNVCQTNFSSKQALKKHTIMFHIMNKPYSGSKRYSSQRKGNIIQANMLKQWKCRHCKQAFRTRKVLVHHLKKCDYNSFEDMKGICLQCGKWCESGKTRICQFCLPDLAKDPDFDKKRMLELSKMRRVEQLIAQGSQQPKAIKQEFPLDYTQQSHSSFLGNMPQKMAENIKKEVITAAEAKEISRSKGSKNNAPSAGVSDIHLMKCPIGNKYFRSEITMVRHYSECDGSCENRCSQCRKLFNTLKEYERHLLFSKCFGPRKSEKRKAKMRYPTFACKKKKVRRDLPNSSRLGEDLRAKLLKQTSDKLPDNFLDVMEVSAYSEDNSSVGVESSSSSFSFVNKATEEKSLKLGRICTVCNKVITTQRALYRHAYCCFKTILLSQDSVTCPKCKKNFNKLVSMKENAVGIKQHILDCYFVPYYIGQGIRDDGSRLDTPPQYLCYICSFGFSSNECLTVHIKDHRHNKDETNNIVLQLEEELLSDERMANDMSMFSFHIKDVKTLEAPPVLVGRVLSLQDSFPKANQPKRSSIKVFECDTCSRKFYNKKKYLRHKRVHGIISETVYKETAVENFVEVESGNALSNT